MSQIAPATPERAAEIVESLSEIRSRVKAVSSESTVSPTLVAVSKFKPASDVLVCYENGQLDFGENYVQELVDKARKLPKEIRWHFIGTLQSNKSKLLATIPNLDTIQTLTSEKAAYLLNSALGDYYTKRGTPLKVLIQINTSGEAEKSGLLPLASVESAEGELLDLAKYIITHCPFLRFQGLMTIGALEHSLNASETEKNADFDTLKQTRDVLQEVLSKEFSGDEMAKWGYENTGRLVLSMGMSGDFEAALKSGSDIVRVGTGIFGEREKKSVS